MTDDVWGKSSPEGASLDTPQASPDAAEMPGREGGTNSFEPNEGLNTKAGLEIKEHRQRLEEIEPRMEAAVAKILELARWRNQLSLMTGEAQCTPKDLEKLDEQIALLKKYLEGMQCECDVHALLIEEASNQQRRSTEASVSPDVRDQQRAPNADWITAAGETVTNLVYIKKANDTDVVKAAASVVKPLMDANDAARNYYISSGSLELIYAMRESRENDPRLRNEGNYSGPKEKGEFKAAYREMVRRQTHVQPLVNTFETFRLASISLVWLIKRARR